jgi:hypothetical protein
MEEGLFHPLLIRSPTFDDFSQLASLLLGWPAESSRILGRRLEIVGTGAGVFFGWSQIFEKLGDPGRADSLLEQGEHLDGAVDATRQRGDHVASTEVTGGFDPQATDFDVAGVAGLNRQ